MLFKNYNELIKNGKNCEIKKKRKDLLDILTYAIKEVNPYFVIKKYIKDGKIFLDNENIDTKEFDNIYLIGFGKASINMGRAVLDSLKIKKAVLITNDKKTKINDNKTFTYIGSHPLPNLMSIKGTNHILEIIKESKKQDLIIVLISGGGSALLSKPRIKIEDLKEITELLLKTNMNISEINTIRKHLSYVKGGQLLYNVNCKVVSLIISDIVNDPIEFIASGPTFPDSTTFNDAKNILLKHHIWHKTPNIVKNIIDKGISGEIPETPKKENLIFKNVKNYIIANNESFVHAAQYYAKKIGYKSKILSTSLTGEAKYVGKKLINQYKDSKEKKIFIASGETTVNVVGMGKGGRNQEMVLGSIKYIKDKNIVFASFATDGIDGNSDAAGAIADKHTLNRAVAKKLNPSIFLENNDSYEFFRLLNDLLITGPTGTNLIDIQIILC